MNTTLNKIREHSPCEESWVKLLESLNKTKADDEPIALKYILEKLGIRDAVWALRTIDAEKEIRLFACDCAETSLKYYVKEHPNDNRVQDCIVITRKMANGDCSYAARAAGWDAAWDAGWDAASHAASHAARNAASAACSAAYDAASDAAYDAASDAARAAAWDAARTAASAACSAACSAAYDAAWDAAYDAYVEFYKKYFC